MSKGQKSILIDKKYYGFLTQLRKICVFHESCEKLSKARVPFEWNGMGRLVTKMNISFFMGNYVLNIFSSNNCFEESYIFHENCENKFWGPQHFLEKRVILH